MEQKAEEIVKIISDMKHMLGIDIQRTRKGQIKYECYRNYFSGASAPLDKAKAMGLVEKEDTNKISGLPLYYVNKAGFSFMSKILGIEVFYKED